MKTILSFLLIILSFQTFAEEEKENSAVSQLVDDSKNDLMIVVGGGAAGAILGLSTLSFVDEPKEHTKNILTGAAIGIIAGVVYVVYNQANSTKNMVYSMNRLKSDEDFNTYSRKVWHDSIVNQSNLSSQRSALNYSFSY